MRPSSSTRPDAAGREAALLEAADPASPSAAARRRLEAGLAVLAETADADADEPVIAVQGYGPGCLAMAIAGGIPQSTVDRLRILFDDPVIRELGAHELVINLAGVRPSSDPNLARPLSGLQARRIAEGCLVELRDPHRTLELDLGVAAEADAFGGPDREDP